LSYARSRAGALNIEENFYSRIDIHVHVPAGAIPKDGPSAGVTIATALISALTKTQVRKDLAMTGEITLLGRVLAIGGLKEKALAALRANISTIVIPEDNKKDVEEIPRNLRRRLRFVYVKHVDEVLSFAFPSKEEETKSLTVVAPTP